MINGQSVRAFSSNGTLAAAGYAITPAIFTFSTQDSTTDPVTFSATAIAAPSASPIPEPSSLALLGTGAFGLAGVLSRKLRRTAV